MKRLVIAAAVAVAALGLGAGAAWAGPAASDPPGVVRIGDAIQIGEGAVHPAAVPGSSSTGALTPSGTTSPLENPLVVMFVLLAMGAVGATAYRRVHDSAGSLAPATVAPDPELILVVDDEPAFRRSVARMLTDSGYKVHEVEDGATALDAINAGLRPSLVLTDVAMPGVSGTELSDRLEHHGLFNTVLMSGRDLAVESTRFLRKPFREGELLTLVRRELVGAGV